MKCTLYQTTDAYNKLDKTLSESSELDCKINQSIGYTDLDLRVECKTEWIYNYVLFNDRYYFIREITAKSKDIYDIVCHIDVLMTYNEQIKNTTATSIISDTFNNYSNNVNIHDDVRKDSEKILYDNPFNADGNYVMVTTKFNTTQSS